jgi:lathosterol oxidase
MNSFFRVFTFAFASSAVRYLFFAGIGYIVCYIIGRRVLLHRKIQARFPQGADYLREIVYSLTTCVIFGVVAAIIFSPAVSRHTALYFRVQERGWLYFVATIPIMIVIHDAYFYWSHRLLHWLPIFRVVHAVHHRSNNPSPWAALAFHPLEALVQAGVFVILAFFIAVHPLALLIFFLWTTFSNVVGHLGFELFSRRFTACRWGRWFNSSTNHNLHHQKPHGNYGLFFRFWDEWMGTTHSDYDEVLRTVQAAASRLALSEFKPKSGCGAHDRSLDTSNGDMRSPRTPMRIPLVAASSAVLGWPGRRWHALRSYARACASCGYLPDPPTKRGRVFSKRLSRFLVWLQVGKIEITGTADLFSGGPKIIAANHPHSVDPFIFGVLLPGAARYMTARGVMKFCGGLGALILGPCGAFCADLRRGKGVAALKSAVRVLTSGQTLVIFPEGWAHLDGITRPFKRGVVYIAREAAAQLGHPIPIVPVHLQHGAHPGSWINRLNPRLQFLLVPLAFPIYRRGVKVTVGAPILSSALPASDASATAHLRAEILSLDAANNRGRASASEPIREPNGKMAAAAHPFSSGSKEGCRVLPVGVAGRPVTLRAGSSMVRK